MLSLPRNGEVTTANILGYKGKVIHKIAPLMRDPLASFYHYLTQKSFSRISATRNQRDFKRTPSHVNLDRFTCSVFRLSEFL